jgi:hypothetical protein
MGGVIRQVRLMSRPVRLASHSSYLIQLASSSRRMPYCTVRTATPRLEARRLLLGQQVGLDGAKPKWCPTGTLSLGVKRSSCKFECGRAAIGTACHPVATGITDL